MCLCLLIETAVSEQGLRIMAMLYLTPVLPLGPVSYMCGTTSMALSSFALAKVASLPLMTLYVFIGASTGTLLSDPSGSEAKKIEENKSLIVMGIVLSAVMITGISRYIRKELDKVSERSLLAVLCDMLSWSFLLLILSCATLDTGTKQEGVTAKGKGRRKNG
jgi:hypothetical protein